ncbi:hypothetical protein MKEN_00388300 [Mycena kentingensis (nom. inval.)]|nr:hypothetical protein MKEN_00388300 [Mycena kentingensis (nom. inval.)]
MGLPRPIFEYFVTTLDQRDVQHQPAAVCAAIRLFRARGAKKVELEVDFRTTVRAPLGAIAHARSGDKGSDANVGFFVEHQNQYEWLRWLLSVDKLIELLGEDYKGKKIDRFELPHLMAVHFLLHDHLDRGVSCTTTVDFLGKNVAEFLRAREVDIPRRFLASGNVLGKL